MSLSYKTDERIIRNIVRNNINVTNGNDYLNLIIYYKSPTTAQLATKNNTKKRNKLNSTNAIYQCNNCTNEDNYS